jgi:HSP20 family protein
VFDSTRRSGARLDTYRIDDTFHVDIDLPGGDPADIDVKTGKTALTVRAQRRATERPLGTVIRQMPLPDGLDTDRLDARYDGGVLTVSIPLTARTAAS